MKSFKKEADTESISIGDNSARYYLSKEFIAQIPKQNTPLFFPKESLPTENGKITTLGGDANELVVRLQTNPESPEPDLGDVRARLTMTDFYGGSYDRNDRSVSVVAEQGIHLYGERHRTLNPWDSDLTSWKDRSDLKVNWLEDGSTSFDDMVSDFRDEAWGGIKTTVISLRLWGFTCIVLAVILSCIPLLMTWSSTRTWANWKHGTRDVLMLILMTLSLSLALALPILALPWLHYFPLCGGGLLLGGVLFFVAAPCMLWTVCDSSTNFEFVLNEHGIGLPTFVTRRLHPPVPPEIIVTPPADDTNAAPEAGTADIENEMASLGMDLSRGDYGALGDAPSGAIGGDANSAAIRGEEVAGAGSGVRGTVDHAP